jgi:hypothetical protein
MFRERREEIRHIQSQQAEPDGAEKPERGRRVVSDMELFAKMGINPKARINPKG